MIPVNILLLVIDTLRYDCLGANGSSLAKTPNLDALAASSWVFDFSFTNSYPTIPHRTDLITGRYGGPFYPWRPLRYDVPTLPQILAEAGYRTQLLHDTPHLVNGGHNFDFPFHGWYMIRGAEVDRPWVSPSTKVPSNWSRDPLFDFVDEYQFIKDQRFSSYVRANGARERDEDWNAARLFLTACQWLRENASQHRFFLWLDCFDPHEPWDAPPEYVRMYDHTPGYSGGFDPRSWSLPLITRNHGLTLMSQAAIDRTRAYYVAKVTWVDRWVGELLNTLEATGLDKHTAILVTADHGTNLGEWERFGKSHPVREWEAHTPLLIHVPGGGSGRCNCFVQPQDLFATIVSLAGGIVPPGVDSYDLLRTISGQASTTRQVALCGQAASPGWKKKQGTLFTVLGRDAYLEFALDARTCRLHRYGEEADIAPGNAGLVEELRNTGLDELARQGTPGAVVNWLRTSGASAFPEDCPFWDGWPGPAGFTHYWQNHYREWRGSLFA